MNDFDDLAGSLKQVRDELKLQIHLASKEVQDDWEELEGKMENFAAKAGLDETGLCSEVLHFTSMFFAGQVVLAQGPDAFISSCLHFPGIGYEHPQSEVGHRDCQHND